MNSQQLKNKYEQLIQPISRWGNILLVTGLGAILAMMIIPLPTFILDLLITINIMVSLTLMMAAISIEHTMKLSSFPPLLLITTLFRLGLNIASTRSILSTGEAGHIIHTFGYFATGGNMLVGMVIFLVVTLIQFIVVAKGSERVAEVAARFTLDAMPGKQMSIDADLRAGMITQDEAKASREALHRESKMFGAMDGAMKFVKGDAIAGILIIFINLLGGLATGIFSRGLSFSQALHTYSILTIGDGLVSQIPSLLVSITAGFIVTRVTDSKNEKSLGAEIGNEFSSQPKALIMSACLSFAIGLIPGFPTLLFWMVGSILGGTAFYLINLVKKEAEKPISVESYVIETERQMAESWGVATPFTVEVGPELYKIFVTDPRWTHCFGTLYTKLKLHLSNQLGVLLPDIKLAINNSLSQTFNYKIKIYEVPVDNGILNPHHCSAIGSVLPANESVIEEPENRSETVHGTPVMLWSIEKQSNLRQRGLKLFAPEEMLMRHLAKVLTKHAGDFVGIQEVRHLLNAVEINFSELVREVVPKMMSIQKLTDIVKRLVDEGVPIRDFRLILETLSVSQPESKDPVSLTEQVRIGLKRTITALYTEDNNQLPVVTLSGEIEEEIASGIQKNGTECYLTLPPERIQAITAAIRLAIDPVSASQKCIILTNLEIRRYVRKIIEDESPFLAVLSYQELDPRVMIVERGHATFNHDLMQVAEA